VPECEPRIILATGSYIGEGFDDARLDTLFLAMPISWKGTLQQYVGRLHRFHDAKRVVRVYDYVDSNVLMLARMYARRLKEYNLIGYTIRDAKTERRSFSGLRIDLLKSLRSTEKRDETERSPDGSASAEAERRVWDKSPFAQQGEAEGTDRTSDRGWLRRRRTSGRFFHHD
jgi:superfamily II DNA or RNA helicase